MILPTALGKTVISALVVARTLYEYARSRVLVMAPTRPLILQHRASFQGIIRLPEGQFALLTGKTPPDYRASIWNGGQRVVFATPEVVRNDLLERRLTDLGGFGLLVFDECHHAVKEYAYTEVAERYLKAARYPLILGMTASPGSDPERVSSVCRSLSIERVEYRSEEDPDVRPYINPVAVGTRTVPLPPQYLPARDALREMLGEKIHWLQNRGYLRRDKQFVTRRSLIEAGSEMRYGAELAIEEESGPAFSAISVQAQALTLFHMVELLESQGSFTLRRFMDKLEEDGAQRKSHRAIVSDPRYATLSEAMAAPGFPDHPKIEELVRMVSAQVGPHPESRVLVFTQYRDTASHLVDALNQARGGAIRAERFVGQASRGRDKGMGQDRQAALIEDLRRGYVNTLCSTSIAEEGLDIPEVDLVVFYEPIPSEIRYIQRRGRTGRKAAGRVVILAAEGTTDTAYLQASERRTEAMRGIVSSLNGALAPLARRSERPPADPMEGAALAALARLEPSTSLSAVKTDEQEKAKVFEKRVARAEQDAYMSLLEDGVGGTYENVLHREMEELGHPEQVVAAAMKRLYRRKLVSLSHAGNGTRVVLLLKNIPDARVMVVEVRKVVQGGALVVVDDEKEALLDSANYAGPRELIKKGRRFRALCEMYTSQEGLNLNVRQVLETDG